jgi:hypothetical protein
MYRQGLGDCFLVSLPGSMGVPFHLLIDCGVHVGTPGEVDMMQRVARDIETTVGGRLDVVVASHDHWDHVSGFVQARSVFNRVEIIEVWLSWAEDSADVGAQAFRRKRDRDLRGLRVLANRLSHAGQMTKARNPATDRLKVPLSFFGPESGGGPREALDYLKDHPSRPRVRYLRAGVPEVPLIGSSGSSASILGPSPERSLDGKGPSASLSLFAASGGLPIEDAETAGLCDAFDERYRLAPEKAEQQPFFRKRYLADDLSWRQIDFDWMGTAEPLALDLDSRTNDLSLALAIEVEPGGRVLLFPGDAQASQWAGWQRLRWPGIDTSSPSTTATDLLGRTVLYKVAHHAAAGATPGPGGLDLMTSPDLVAMLTIDADLAQEAGWRMPDPDLLSRLLRATRGRLLRSDQQFPDRPEVATVGEWEAFREAVTFDSDGLYIDFHLGL